ncbi:MAG TPA: HIT family protein [Allosphingosinicella sp.]|nr:HIT family protein [Allosphingosinicella sp.]
MPPHETLTKFGYPDTLIAEYSHWAVLLRPQQATIGSLVVASVADIRRFSEVPREGFAELAEVIQQCESALSSMFAYDKINYLMLMMVDLQVHMHVIPRYAEVRDFAGVRCLDEGWPGPPILGASIELPADGQLSLLSSLKDSWQGAGR